MPPAGATSLRFLLAALAAPAGLLLCAGLVGTAVVRRAPFRSRTERLFVAFTAGTGIAGTAFFLAGLAGLFSRGMFLAALAGAVALRVVLKGRRRATGTETIPGGFGERLALAAAAVVFLAHLPLALLPPTGFDATMYHLTAVKRYLGQGAVGYLPHVRLNWLPQLNEMLAAPLLAWGPDIGTQVFALAVLCAGGLGVYCLAARLGGQIAAAASAVLYLASPVGSWCAVNAYVEPQAALFVIAGVLLLVAWHQDEAESFAPLAGLCLGFAAATKPNVLPVVAFLGLLAAVSALRRGSRRGLLPMGLLFALVAGPWYVRTWLLTGDPLYPMMSLAVGATGGPLSEGEARGMIAGLHAFYGIGHGFSDFLALPFTMTRQPGRFHELAVPLSGALPAVAPVAVLLAPLAPAPAAAVAAAALVDAAAWFRSFQQSRFLLPAFALLCAAAAPALAGSHVTGRRRTLGTGLLLLLAFWGAVHDGRWLAASLRVAGPIPVDAASRAAFLRARLQGYRLVEEVNRRTAAPRVVYCLGFENLAYFVDGETVGDWFGVGSYGRVAAAVRAGTPLRDVLARLGVTHVIVDPARRSAVGLELPGPDRGFTELAREAGGATLLVVGPPPASP